MMHDTRYVRIAPFLAALIIFAVFGVRGSAPADASKGHRGGTMLIVTESNPGTVDTAINYGTAWAEIVVSYDGLTAYQRVGGAAGTKLVPDLATALPIPTHGGLTYTFHVRRNIRFSNGAVLKPSDFRHTFERMFAVRGPTTGPFYSDIVGAAACLQSPASCNLSRGIVANNARGTVVFHLTRPDAEFLDKLALPFAFVVPSSAPNKDVGTHALPGTGPYRFATYTPNGEIKLVRNPYFRVWSAAAQPAGYPNTIVVKFGVPLESEVTEVENGQADWVFSTTGLPPDRLNEISTRFPAQTHVNLATAIYYMALNTRVPPFNNLRARQALNFATDRNALVKLQGGPRLARPSCQMLPPNFPGYVQYCPYTAHPAPGGHGPWTAPDMARAQQLVNSSGTKGEAVTIVNPSIPLGRATGLYFESLLNRLGYKASLKLLAPAVQDPYAKDSRHRVQISLSVWYQDYQAASDFLNVLTGCGSFQPNSGSQPNISEFCNRRIQNLMNRALAREATNRSAANVLWSRVDTQVTNQAPVVVMFNPAVVNFVSKRIGHFLYNPQWGLLMDQAWVK